MKASRLPILLSIVGTVLFLGGGMLYDLYLEKPSAVLERDVKIDPSRWESAPDFSFINMRGETVSLKGNLGKPVILLFWATWCPTCVIEFPDVLKRIESYNGDVVLVAMASDDSVGIVQKFLEKQPADLKAVLQKPYVHIGLDRDRSITRDMFLTERYPETIFITKDGKMARKTVGLTDWKKIETSPEWKAILPR